MLMRQNIKFFRRLLKISTRFWQGFSAQYCLLVTIEKWKEIVDHGDVFCALVGVNLFQICKVLEE